MTAAVAERQTPTSSVTERSRALVAERTPEALVLGREAGDLVTEPAAFAAALRAGLGRLADPDYLDGQRRIAPGIGALLGVRQPLLAAVSRGIRATTRHDRATTLLDATDALLRLEVLEAHWLAFDLLDRTIVAEPERTWQRVRGESANAADWITVDSLAHVAGRGVLAEPYRWAELEQLVYSPSRWERRLVGSTIATIPHVDREAGRRPEVARKGLAILADLIGDSDPDVQKAISWALRALAAVDIAATVAFLRREAATARDTDDGHRAWVVRDTLEKLPAAKADELRATVDGIRRRPGAPSTSRAAAAAAAFTGLGVAVPPADRPVVDRD
jgi:3-methyladenine DNA glycosylase AlkD